jgi:hypothetical protein
MSVSEPGGELREALQSQWDDWREKDPMGLMQFSDFLAPEIEAVLRVTFRFLLRSKVPVHARPSEEDMHAAIDEWVEHFAVTLRDKRPTWLDQAP